MTRTPNEIVEQMDWALLREQRNYCVNEAANNAEAAPIYEGLVALIEALQDSAYENRFASYEEVFGDVT